MADIQSNIRVNIDTNNALASLKVLQSQISAFHQELARGSAAAAQESARMSQNFMNSVNKSGKFAASMTNVKSTTESFTTALEKNQLSLGQYFRYAGAATKDFGKLFGKEFDTINKVARERVKDLQTQYIQMGRDANGAMKAIKVRPLTLDLQDLGTKTQIAAQKQQLLNQLLKQGSTNMLNWGKNTQWAGRQLMVGFTVPLTMMGQIASREFMKMEESVISFKRVYGDLNTTMAETDKMAGQIQTLAQTFTKYGVAVSDVMGMAAKAAAMGKQGADLLEQVQSATTLAVLGGVDQQQALETTISLTNAFGTATEDLKDKINFLNVVENQTVTSIEDFTVAIPKAAPVIKQLGGDVEDLAFFLTAMKEGGINASEGANALKSGLASMINPTKKASDFLQGFGINLKGIVEANKGDVRGMVTGFAESLNQLDPLNRARAIEQLFGKFQFARISTLFKNITDSNSQAATVAKLAMQGPEASAILAQRELKRIEESPMFKFKKALEDLKVQLIPLGEQFLKAVTPIATFFTDMLKNFNGLGTGTKDAVGIITIALAGIGPVLLMTVGLVANGIANIIKGFAAMKSFFNGAVKSTTDLGAQTNYMTQEQIEAASVAASLDQVHTKLTQTFTSEASAVAAYRKELERAVTAQNQFKGFAGGTGTKTTRGKKMANGGIVRGPGGPKDDLVPTDLSNGEAVIPVDGVKKNPRIISALISGARINIPGYANGFLENKRRSSEGTVRAHLQDKLNLNDPKIIGQILQSYPDYASMPEDVKKRMFFSGSLTADLPRGLNEQLKEQKGGALASDFAKQWSGSQDKLTGSAIAGGMDPNDPKQIKALSDIEDKIGLRATELAKAASGKVTDTILSSATSQIINETKNSKSATSRKLASALESRAGVIGDYRTDYTRDEMKRGLSDGTLAMKPGTKQLIEPKSGMQVGDLRYSQSQGKTVGFKQRTVPFKGTGGYLNQPFYGRYTGDTGPTSQSSSDAATKAGQEVAKAKSKSFENGIATGAKKEGQIASPSKVTKEIGANYGKGFIVGSKEQLNQVKKVVGPSAGSLQYAAGQVKNAISGMVDKNNVISINRLRQAEMQRVQVITQEEKNLRFAGQVLSMNQAPAKAFWGSIDKIGKTASAAGTMIKNNALNNFALLKVGVKDLGDKVKATAQSISASAKQVLANGKNMAKNMAGRMGGMGAGMGIMMGMGALSAAPGAVGQTAQSLMGPLSAASTAMMMLPGPIGVAVGAVAALAIGAVQLKAAFTAAQKEAVANAKATGASTEAINGLAEASGKVSSGEIMDKRRENALSGIQTTEEQNQMAESYVASAAGQGTVNAVTTALQSGGSKAAVSSMVSQMTSAVAAGAISAIDAKAIVAEIGNQLGDQTFAIRVSGQMDQLIGPNGERLSGPNAIATRGKVLQAGAQSLQVSTAAVQNVGADTEDDSYLERVAKTLLIVPATIDLVNYYGDLAVASGSFAANLTIAQQNSQSMLDSLQLEYEQRIANAKAAGDEAEASKLQAEYEQGRIDLLKQSGDIYKQAADAYSKFDSTKKTAVIGSLDEQIKGLYAEGPMKAIAEQAISDIGASTADGSTQELTLKTTLASGEIDPTTMSNAINLLGGDEKASDIVANLVLKSGGAETDRMLGLASFGTGEENQAAAIENFGKMSVEDQTGVSSVIEQAGAVGGAAASGGLVDQLAGAKTKEQLAEVTKKIKDLGKAYTEIDTLLADGPITAEVLAKTSGFESMKVNAEWFDDLPASEQKIAMTAYLTVTETIDANTEEGKERIRSWYAQKYGSAAATQVLGRYVSYDEALQQMASDTAQTAVDAAQNAPDAPGGDDDADSPGGGGTQKTAAEKKMDLYNAAMTEMSKKEDKVNKAYDERLKAMDKIEKANERINQQKKDELDLADALSKGDIGAAARAQQQARQNAQTAALQSQRDSMEASRQAQLDSLTVGGKTRAQIQALIDAQQNKEDKSNLKNLYEDSGLTGWKFSTGGLVPDRQYFANGGKPRGTDTIAAMLTPGEFVVKKSAVDKLGTSAMNSINNGKLPKSSGTSSSNSVYNYSITVNGGSGNAEEIANKVLDKIKRVENQAMRGNRTR